MHNSSGCLGEDKTRPQTRYRERNNAKKAGKELRAEYGGLGVLAARCTAGEGRLEKRRARLDVEMDVSVGVGF